MGRHSLLFSEHLPPILATSGSPSSLGVHPKISTLWLSRAQRASELHCSHAQIPCTPLKSQPSLRCSGQAGAVPLQVAGFAVILGQSELQSPGCPVLSRSHPQRMRTAGSTNTAPLTFLLKGHVHNFPKLPVISELQHFWGYRLLSISPHGKRQRAAKPKPPFTPH